MAAAGDAVPQLVIIGQAVHQGSEAADLIELPAAGGHDCTEGEVDGLKTPRLQDLTPEVGIDGNRLPLHRQRGRIGEAIEAAYQAAGLRSAAISCCLSQFSP